MKFHGVILTDSFTHFRVKSLGAYRIANELRKLGYNILVLDMFRQLPRNTVCRILDLVISDETLFVGYGSTMFLMGTHGHKTKREEREIADIKFYNEYIKKLSGSVKIVFGGSVVGKMEPYLKQHDTTLGIDYLVFGFAEGMMRDLFLSFLNKHDIGHHFTRTLSDGTLHYLDYDKNGERFDFRNTPHEWHELDCVLPHEGLPIEIARGCSFKCKFCFLPLVGKKLSDNYVKSEEALTREILNNYEKYKTDSYAIADNTFNERTDKIEILARIRDKTKIDLNFTGYARLDLIARKPEQLALLKAANFNGFFFGVESFHRPSAKAIGKGMDPNESKDTIAKIKDEYGHDKVSITVSTILGLPYETPDTAAEWLTWLEENPIVDTYRINPLVIGGNHMGESELLANHTVFNYKLYRDEHGSQIWKNDIWSYNDCVEMGKIYDQRAYYLNRNKIIALRLPGARRLGYGYYEAMQLTYKDLDTKFAADINSRIESYKTDYVTRLMSLLMQQPYLPS